MFTRFGSGEASYLFELALYFVHNGLGFLLLGLQFGYGSFVLGLALLLLLLETSALVLGVGLHFFASGFQLFLLGLEYFELLLGRVGEVFDALLLG